MAESTGRNAAPEEIFSLINSIRENISRVIVGKQAVTDLLLASFFAGGHVLLEDLPGTGKTMLAKTMAKSLACDFRRIQFTPDLLPSDVTGLNYFDQKISSFTFRPGPVFTQLLLADEINRATPRTQSALLECMEERQVTVDGETRLLEEPFFVIATENPVETYGCFPLPQAQLDRFLMKLSMGDLSREDELTMLDRFTDGTPLAHVTAAVSREQAVLLRNACREVYVHPELRRFIVDIVQRTRTGMTSPGGSMTGGVSPRGTLALVRASQGCALTAGRDYVVPEDIKTAAVPVLAHRLICDETEEAGKKDMILRILSQVPVPTEDWKKR